MWKIIFFRLIINTKKTGQDTLGGCIGIESNGKSIILLNWFWVELHGIIYLCT